MEGVLILLGGAVAFMSVVGGVLIGIAALTGAHDEAGAAHSPRPTTEPVRSGEMQRRR